MKTIIREVGFLLGISVASTVICIGLARVVLYGALIVVTMVNAKLDAMVAADAPGITEGQRLLLQSTQLAGSNASAPCSDSVNKYVTQRQAVAAYFEGEYPGWTIDWTQLPAVLKAKAP
jgi:hypothetical protein